MGLQNIFATLFHYCVQKVRPIYIFLFFSISSFAFKVILKKYYLLTVWLGGRNS